jgi:hypothetical protein
MAKRPTINTLTNTASPTYLTQLNQNFTNIQAQFDNTLSLDGSLPNAMNADLDLNDFDLINAGTVNADNLVVAGTNLNSVVAQAATSATNAATSASAAAASATTASQYTPAYFNNVAALLADTRAWPTGQILNTREEGFAYKVAASGATDQHVTTAGGVKLYVLPSEDDSVSILQFGASTTLANNAPAIQKAWDNFNWVTHPVGVFDITEPLYVRRDYLRLTGASSGGGGFGSANLIRKTTTTVGTGSNTSRGGAVTDSYAVNAIVIATHPNDSYRFHITMEHMNFEAQNFDVELGIFAPRVAMWTLDNVSITRAQVGWRTFDGWLQDWRSVRYHGNTVSAAAAAAGVGTQSGWVSGSTGFQWAADGSGGGTGPGNTFKSCWARNCHLAWDITGMGYGQMQSCGADNISQRAYRFISTRVTLSGCAMENVFPDQWMIEVSGSNSHIVMDGFTTDPRMIGSSTGTTAMLRISDGAKVIMDGCRLENYSTPGTSFNLSIVGGSRLISENSQFPTNGNAFVSYADGTTWVDTTNGVTEWRSSAGTKSTNTFDVLPGSNQAQVRSIGKAIGATATAIATVTISGTAANTRASAYLDIHVGWLDTSFPNGGGLSRVSAVFSRYDGPGYQESATVYSEVRAGNSLTGFPTFSLSRVGDVWTVSMTPADGACTADITLSVSSRVVNGGAFTVAAV